MSLLTRPHYLLATLGGKPQAIITALDKLLAQHIPITHLLLFHTAQGSPRIDHALSQVRHELVAANYYHPPLHFEAVPLMGGQGPLADVVTPEEIDGGFRTIYRTMLLCKQQGAHLHFCPVGGRKTMTLFSMAAAQLLFEEGDVFWHVVAEGEFLASERLHPEPGDEVYLVQVPLLRWLNVTPALLHQEAGADPYRALQHSQQLLQSVQQQRLGEFLTHWLSRAEADVAKLIVREGLDNKALGERLGRSDKTVANQLTNIYHKLAEFLQLPQDAKANRHLLITTFAAYLVGKQAGG